MKIFKYLLVMALAIVMAACGGGGGSSGTTGAGGAAPVASDFIFTLDKTTVVNAGSDKAVLTVTALDNNRNVVSGVPVTVAVDAGGIFTPGSSASTDTSGQFSGTIAIGGDKSNRTINATITVNKIIKVASVVVTGSQISVTPVPATPTPGQLVTLNIATTNSSGSAIQSAALVLSGTAGVTGPVTTDSSGNKTLIFTAPAVQNSYTIVVSGLGVSTTKNIQVITLGGTGKPDVTAVVSSASLNPTPTSILANVAGSTTSRSKLSAKFQTAGNAAIENMRVRFEIVPPSLGGGEAISTGVTTVYTDAQGVAEADYISGIRSSPTNGVAVRACYKKTDFSNANDCPNSVAANLTVAGTPLSISITDDNTMAKGLGGIAYIKQFLIQVNDASGVAVQGAVISASVDITHYGKGAYGGVYPIGSIAPTIVNGSLSIYKNITNVATGAYDTVFLDSLQQAINPPISPIPYAQTVRPWSVGSGTNLVIYNVWCANEDVNRNGFLDSGEDTNRDLVLQPRKAEIIVSYVNGNTTDANGQMLVQVSYGQNMGSWLAYTLRATTGVAGSEGDASKSYITGVLKEDVANGSFLTPPYGTKACNESN